MATLDSASLDRLRSQLELHEGLRLKPYTDTVGKLTIGIGRNLSDVGISEAEARMLLDHDILEARAGLEARYPWFVGLDTIRQRVLIDMAFNLGAERLAQFQNTLKAVAEGRWSAAKAGMLNSLWASQVGKRAIRLAQMMETGEDYTA